MISDMKIRELFLQGYSKNDLHLGVVENQKINTQRLLKIYNTLSDNEKIIAKKAHKNRKSKNIDLICTKKDNRNVGLIYQELKLSRLCRYKNNTVKREILHIIELCKRLMECD